jgi:archaellum biogenesis ATPase FlaH
MATPLPIGIDVLDQRLGGGVPPGSIVALCAPPASQAELLLYEFMGPRETLYLALDRTERGVTEALRRTTVDTGDPDVQAIPDENRVDHVLERLGGRPRESTVIVDHHTVIEIGERDRVPEFVTRLSRHLADTGGVVVLYCLDGDPVPERRATTLHSADVVVRLTVDVVGATVDTRLAVPKVRGGRALTETLKLQLTDRVTVDTSRDIA